MGILKPIGAVLIWVTGLVLVYVGVHDNDPFLVHLRGPGNIVLAAASILVAVILVRRGYWSGRGFAGKLLVLLWVLPSLSILSAKVSFELVRQRVLRTDAARAWDLGRHFIVGYSSFPEVASLAEKGLIGGVYIGKHNVAGRTREEIKSEIAALQDRRRISGLPPLIIVADQEGGIVSHLAPPLTALPSLSVLNSLSPEVRARAAEEFGRIHGRELSELGINLNFAPVLDLRPGTERDFTGRDFLDQHTLIKWRAISGDPAVVADVALAYVRGLESFGVGATVKHFPGLGRVRSDTHLVSVSLGARPEDLEASDWRPFKDVLAQSKALLMVGHVKLSAIDPDRPASHSRRVIDGIIRKRWNYQGPIVTDDLVMGAIYHHDVCRAVVQALNAGADLLLVAYDGAQFYRIFACASDGADRGALDAAMLRASEARLTSLTNGMLRTDLSADSVHLVPPI